MTPPRITAWSYSRWRDYQQCPFKTKLKVIDKRKEPGSPAMDRGGDIHKKAELYVKGELIRFPKELENFKDDIKHLRKIKAHAEDQWSFNAKWQLTEWMAEDIYLRMKLDVFYQDGDTLVVIDYKTGKQRPEQDETQLKLYALAGLLVSEAEGWGVEKVRCELWYLDHEKDNRPTLLVDKTELLPLKKFWLGAVKPMLADTRFAPKPGNYCRWCHFRKANGGPCAF